MKAFFDKEERGGPTRFIPLFFELKEAAYLSEKCLSPTNIMMFAKKYGSGDLGARIQSKR